MQLNKNKWVLIIFLPFFMSACTKYEVSEIVGLDNQDFFLTCVNEGCISSELNESDRNYLEPLAYQGNASEIRRLVLSAISLMKGATLEAADSSYMRVHIKRLFRAAYLEIYVDQQWDILHMRIHPVYKMNFFSFGSRSLAKEFERNLMLQVDYVD